jgi:hypothetical protein
VQRAEHQVPGLGGSDRHRDRLEVAHLADQDHVGSWRSARRSAFAERRAVLADLRCVTKHFLSGCTNSSGILHGQDVAVLGLVDVVDHRRERRRLARARSAR